MNLFVNMLLEWQSDDEKVNIERVLWIDPSYTDVATIRIVDPKALPIWQKSQDLEESITAKKIIVLETDPYGFLQKPENTIPEKHKERRDKAWDIISPLIEDEGQENWRAIRLITSLSL